MGFYILTLTEWLSAVGVGPHNGGSRAAAERASQSMMFLWPHVRFRCCAPSSWVGTRSWLRFGRRCARLSTAVAVSWCWPGRGDGQVPPARGGSGRCSRPRGRGRRGPFTPVRRPQPLSGRWPRPCCKPCGTDDSAPGEWPTRSLSVLRAVLPFGEEGGSAVGSPAGGLELERGEAVLRLLRTLAVEAPLVVGLEDLQWVDADTLASSSTWRTTCATSGCCASPRCGRSLLRPPTSGCGH